LEHTHWVVRAEHSNGRAEPDAACASRNGREDNLGRRDRKVTTVMLTDANEVHPQLVGKHGLIDDIPNDLSVWQ
jgi:hypothetical protein